MGCDIHLHVEKRNPSTNSWDKMGREFKDIYTIEVIAGEIAELMGLEEDFAYDVVHKYLDGKPPSGKIERYIMEKMIPSKMVGPDSDLDWWSAKESGKFAYPYSDSPYGGRCYALFDVLAGVRGDGEAQISDLRGIPNDVSDVVGDAHKEWESDAHSASHYYLDELLDSDYRSMSSDELYELGIGRYFFHGMLDDINKLTNDPRDIRLVFWFDN